MQVGGWISFMWLVYLVLRCCSFSLHKASDCCVGALQEVGETECHLGNLKSFLTDAAFVYPRGPTAVKQRLQRHPSSLVQQPSSVRLKLYGCNCTGYCRLAFRLHLAPQTGPAWPCALANHDVPLLWLWVHRVPQRVVWVVLKGHPCCGVPLGVLLAEALLGVGSQLQLLALPQLHNQDVYRKASVRRLMRRNERAGWHKGKGRND